MSRACTVGWTRGIEPRQVAKQSSPPGPPARPPRRDRRRARGRRRSAPSASRSAFMSRRRSSRSSSSSPARSRAASISAMASRYWVAARRLVALRGRGSRRAPSRAVRHSSWRWRSRSRRIPRPAKASRRSRWRAGRRSAWCSCWPWTSTRASPSFSRRASVVLASLRNTRPRPPAHELPAHHELAVLQRDAVLLEQGGDRALPRRVEHGLDGGGLGARRGWSRPAGPARRGGGSGRRSGSTSRPPSRR